MGEVVAYVHQTEPSYMHIVRKTDTTVRNRHEVQMSKLWRSHNMALQVMQEARKYLRMS